MKINITKKQYWDLLRAVYLADWMASAICESDMKQDGGIRDIREYIFSFAKDFGFEQFVEYDCELGKHYAAFAFDDEETTRSLVERYDDHTFWQELMHRLSDRDIVRAGDMTHRRNDESIEAWVGRTHPFQDRWSNEMEEHGIDRLEVKE
jgi:hypothetical protein